MPCIQRGRIVWWQTEDARRDDDERLGVGGIFGMVAGQISNAGRVRLRAQGQPLIAASFVRLDKLRIVPMSDFLAQANGLLDGAIA